MTQESGFFSHFILNFEGLVTPDIMCIEVKLDTEELTSNIIFKIWEFCDLKDWMYSELRKK